MPIPLALQLYTLREDAAGDFPAVLRTVAAIGYKGVEFAGLHGMKPADVRKILDDLGLVTTSAHVPVFDPAQADQVLADARTLGYSYLVGGFGPDQFEVRREDRGSCRQVQQRRRKVRGGGFYGLPAQPLVGV